MITRTCGCFHPLYADFEFVIERGQSPCNLTTECELKVVHKLQFELLLLMRINNHFDAPSQGFLSLLLY